MQVFKSKLRPIYGKRLIVINQVIGIGVFQWYRYVSLSSVYGCSSQV